MVWFVGIVMRVWSGRCGIYDPWLRGAHNEASMRYPDSQDLSDPVESDPDSGSEDSSEFVCGSRRMDLEILGI